MISLKEIETALAEYKAELEFEEDDIAIIVKPKYFIPRRIFMIIDKKIYGFGGKYSPLKDNGKPFWLINKNAKKPHPKGVVVFPASKRKPTIETQIAETILECPFCHNKIRCSK